MEREDGGEVTEWKGGRKERDKGGEGEEGRRGVRKGWAAGKGGKRGGGRVRWTLLNIKVSKKSRGNPISHTPPTCASVTRAAPGAPSSRAPGFNGF